MPAATAAKAAGPQWWADFTLLRRVNKGWCSRVPSYPGNWGQTAHSHINRQTGIGDICVFQLCDDLAPENPLAETFRNVYDDSGPTDTFSHEYAHVVKLNWPPCGHEVESPDGHCDCFYAIWNGLRQQHPNAAKLWSSRRGFVDDYDQTEPQIGPMFGGLRPGEPWAPQFYWQPALDAGAGRINRPHEDYPAGQREPDRPFAKPSR